MSASKPARPVSDRKAPFVSFSANFEDVILQRLFNGCHDGFFVDVGAQHPDLSNDTYALHKSGWRGINVEPSQPYHQRLQEERPEDVNLCVALSDKARKEISFFEAENSGCSTCDPQEAKRQSLQGQAFVERKVAVTTLRDILGKTTPKSFELLKVDVEGFEEKVLDGNDWERFRPKVVLVEATYPNSPERRPTSILGKMQARGYRHAHFDGLNDFYLDRTFIAPEGAFLPPNVFDNFERRETVSLRTDFKSAQTCALSLQERLDTITKADETRPPIFQDSQMQHEMAALRQLNGKLQIANEQLRNEITGLSRLLEQPVNILPANRISAQWQRQKRKIKKIAGKVTRKFQRFKNR
jgi:FkbM family methyltransferase